MTDRNPKLWSAKHPLIASFTVTKMMDGETSRRVYTISYSELYAAKVWLRTIIGNVAGTRVGNEIKLEDGITVRSFELDAVLDYELKGDELKWSIDKEDLKMIVRFRRAIWTISPEPIRTLVGTAQVVVQVRQKKVRIKRNPPIGYVSVSELCRNTPVPATVARALLRAANYEKPEYGWAFGPTDLPDIKRLIGLL